jgi:hypothetical protein
MQNLHTLLTENVNGTTFISITAHTEMKLNKTYIDEDGARQPNPHHGRVTKVCEGLNVMVYQNKTTNAYENMVNKRLVSEGFDPKSFEVGPRQWGERIDGTCFVTNKGKMYVEVICLNPGEVTLMMDGKPIKKSAILGQPPAPKAGVQGGLENKVIIRTYGVDTIKEIKINKEHHTQLFCSAE